VRFNVDRRWATLGVAVVLGGIGGSLLGFVTAPVPGDEATQGLAPSQETGPPTTHRPRERLGGASTTSRPRARAAARARPAPATTASRPAPTTTTTRPPTSTGATSTTTTTTLGGTTTSGPPSSTT
jgi:hypothetical protein